MKTVLTIITLVLTMSSQANNRDKYNEILTVEGKFASQKNIKYQVFEFQVDSTLKEVYSNNGTTYFNIELNVGHVYIVRFTSLNNEVKTLFIDAEESGDFQLIVDFAKNNAGVLKYNNKKSAYELKSLPILSKNIDERLSRN